MRSKGNITGEGWRYPQVWSGFPVRDPFSNALSPGDTHWNVDLVSFSLF